MIYTLQVTNDQTRMIRVAACECLKELELNFPVSKRSTHIITTYISIVFASMHVCVMSAHAGMCVHMCVCALMCVYNETVDYVPNTACMELRVLVKSFW